MNQQMLNAYRYVPKNYVSTKEIEENRNFSSELEQALYNNFIHSIPMPFELGFSAEDSQNVLVVDLFGNQKSRGFFLASQDTEVLKHIDFYCGGYKKDIPQLRNVFTYIYSQVFRDRCNIDFLIVTELNIIPVIAFSYRDDLTIDEESITAGFWSESSDFPLYLSPEGLEERQIFSIFENKISKVLTGSEKFFYGCKASLESIPDASFFDALDKLANKFLSNENTDSENQKLLTASSMSNQIEDYENYNR